MWMFILLFFANIFARMFVDQFRTHVISNKTWMEQQLVTIHKNNNVEQEKVDYVEQHYIPRLKFWEEITNKPMFYFYIGLQTLVYLALIGTYNSGQIPILNVLVAGLEAIMIVIVVNAITKGKETVKMIYNVNDLAIESMGLKDAVEFEKNTEGDHHQ